MAAFFVNLWQQIVGFFVTYNWISDTLDILLVALFLYFIIRLVRDSRAEQLLRGIFILVVLYAAAYVFDLKTIQYLLQAIFDNGLLLLIVVFQPEVRRALEQAGNSRSGLARIFGGFKAENNATHIEQWNKAIEATADALEILQKQKMGALVVMERTTRLGEIVRSGTIIEAEPSAALISAVFYNKAPLHDGAMIIRDGKVYAASCILPLTDNLKISRELGTRHRAGVGMSEDSDAIVIILSEETGMISIAEAGELKRNFTRETLIKTLADRIIWNDEEPESLKKIRKFRITRKEKK
jgi:diadenylate cyclase